MVIPKEPFSMIDNSLLLPAVDWAVSGEAVAIINNAIPIYDNFFIGVFSNIPIK